jgi:RNA polymerase sigma-70 factor, ECF subfamily
MAASNKVDESLSQTLYVQLRRMAAGQLRNERNGHSLKPTALVHEAFMRLRDQRNLNPADRAALLATAARQMRQVLIDHARHRNRLKRGGASGADGSKTAGARLSLEAVDGLDAVSGAGLAQLDLLDLGDALDRLAALNERQAEVVTLRFFGGMTTPEIATALDTSTRTVESDWHFARAWLRRELDA